MGQRDPASGRVQGSGPVLPGPPSGWRGDRGPEKYIQTSDRKTTNKNWRIMIGNIFLSSARYIGMDERDRQRSTYVAWRSAWEAQKEVDRQLYGNKRPKV